MGLPPLVIAPVRGLPPSGITPILTMTEFVVGPAVAVTPVGAPGALIGEWGGETVMVCVASSTPASAAILQSPVKRAVTRPVLLLTEQTSGVVLR